MSEVRMDALKKVILFLIQKMAGIFLIALPIWMNLSGFSADDPNEGMLFIISIPIGIWLVFLDELIMG